MRSAMFIILAILMSGCSSSYADATIDTTYHYDSSSTPMGGQAWENKPLTPVGSNYAARQDAPPPADYTKVLVSGARERHTDIKPDKPVMTQEEMNKINKRLAAMDKAMNDIQANQAHEVTGTVTY